MSKLIFVFSIMVVGFAGYTVWEDPTTGAKIRSYLPSGGTVSISSNTAGSKSDLGGMKASGRVTGAVLGAVKN